MVKNQETFTPSYLGLIVLHSMFTQASDIGIIIPMLQVKNLGGTPSGLSRSKPYGSFLARRKLPQLGVSLSWAECLPNMHEILGLRPRMMVNQR